jgi:hypothetical protein
MSAELLRRAAAKMRERAEAVTPGPWSEVADGELMGCFAVVAGGENQFTIAPAVIPMNAEHIASWHPAVALAVADWLDRCAEFAAREDGNGRPWACDTNALKVARAYLGEPS